MSNYEKMIRDDYIVGIVDKYVNKINDTLFYAVNKLKEDNSSEQFIQIIYYEEIKWYAEFLMMKKKLLHMNQ